MNDERHDFDRFMRHREEAARAYVDGDPEPLGRIVTRESPATFFGPQGGSREGADQVWDTYLEGASAFSPGGETAFEILHMAAGDGVAHWAGVQRAKVKLGDSGVARAMDLRVTELFRLEDGEWKLVHRHADPL